jgi:hypothetical protein
MQHRKVSNSKWDVDALPMYPYHACMSSCTEICVESTVDGILQVETLADVDSNSEDSTGRIPKSRKT